jgi:GR25 family glycosyltransferase involved in LPS biosynthesis
MLEVDKIYICNWKKLSDRKDRLISHLRDHGIQDYEWVDNYDKDNWNLEEIVKDYPRIFDATEEGRYLKYSEISLLLKHCWILKDAYHKYDTIMVLEDDVVLVNDFVNRFNLYKKQLPENWDICWVGTCCDLEANLIDGLNVYPASGSRCTHAFIVSQNCIKKVVDDLKNCFEPADFFYNTLIKKFNLSNWWFEPSLAFQNSEYQTTIQNDVPWIRYNNNNK